MPDRPVLVDRRDGSGLCELVLDRPERSNALGVELVEALTRAIASAYLDATRFMVLRSNGLNFCSGFDTPASPADAAGPAIAARAVQIEAMLQLLWEAPFTTVACAQGKAIGAGADLVVACDHRIGATGSRYAFPGFRRFGVSLGNRRLAARVGPRKAFDLVLRSTELDVETAHRCGLITAVAAKADGFETHLAHLRAAR